MERATTEQPTEPQAEPRGGGRRSGEAGRVTDAPGDRPGIPQEAEAPAASGAHWARPPAQAGRERRLHHAGLAEATPVFGTAQPPRGVSGIIRRKAYEIPERQAKHWALLFLADRVDVLEDRLGPALAGPLEGLGFHAGSSWVRANPFGALAGVVVGAWLTKRVLFR